MGSVYTLDMAATVPNKGGSHSYKYYNQHASQSKLYACSERT